ncbi:pyrroloquinoline quinone biosynthesis protein PqqB [Candidatus Sumerlaeota bacterium]|nr:pyrroloquinoline quinone biosynthesis protein PqqB [Candidatus Sumerlaeota bacterium]
MIVRILGSAAGGGLPQWNCRCPNCAAARAGSPQVKPRTQSSGAISADGRWWFLLNVSPDIRQQILNFPELGPADGELRGSRIAGCVLTDAELDHTSGLLLLREGGFMRIFSTGVVRRIANGYLSTEPILSQFGQRPWEELEIGAWRDLPLPSSEPSGLRLRAFGVGEHLPRFARTEFEGESGSVIGLEIEDARTGAKLVYAPCLGEWHPNFAEAARGAKAVLLDGTFWSDDEMTRLGIGTGTARAMGHLPVGGPDGSLARLTELNAPHRVYVHINNTNPMLNSASPEYGELIRRGLDAGTDGKRFEI